MYNVLARGIEQEYLAFAKQFEIGIVAYNPLAGGLLTGKHNREQGPIENTRFEGDEASPSRFPEFFKDILVWASDAYHHDGDDAWSGIQTMERFELPEDYQARFLGANARRLYGIDPPGTIIRERVTEIDRPDWWPSECEIREALKPESSVTRR